jgi:hypothetical protein
MKKYSKDDRKRNDQTTKLKRSRHVCRSVVAAWSQGLPIRGVSIDEKVPFVYPSVSGRLAEDWLIVPAALH